MQLDKSIFDVETLLPGIGNVLEVKPDRMEDRNLALSRCKYSTEKSEQSGPPGYLDGHIYVGSKLAVDVWLSTFPTLVQGWIIHWHLW